MKEERKTKEQLIYELVELRQRLARLEKSKVEHKRVEEELRESLRINQLLLDCLPHPAMLIRQDRIILGTNRIARDAGAEIGNYCWRSFGQSEYIPDEDKHYIRKNVSRVPPGGTKCTFCLADEAFDANKPTNNPEVEAFGQLWDTWWVPIEDNIYLHYAINITKSKQAEEALRKKKSELIQRSQQLEEVNALLNFLLKQREDDKKELEESLLTNIKELVLPQLERLRKSQLAQDQINLLDSLESNIKEIISPFASELLSKFPNLTHSELQIASLIKYGRTTKEAAELLHLSPKTISFHRHNLRRKFGLVHKKANLISYLRSFEN